MRILRLRRLGCLVAVSAWTLAACAGGNDTSETLQRETTESETLERETMDAERVRELGEAYTAAWNEMDPEAVASFHHESSSLQVNDADPAVGHEAIAEVARGFMTAFPDMRLVMDSIRPTPSGAEYFWTFIGTNTGPEGTGNAVRFSGYEEWTLNEAGSITRSLGHFDEAEYQRQLEEGVDG